MTRKCTAAFLGSLGLGFLLALAGMAALAGTIYLRFAPLEPETDHGLTVLRAIAKHEAEAIWGEPSPATPQLDAKAGPAARSPFRGGLEITSTQLDASPDRDRGLAASEVKPEPRRASLGADPDKAALERRAAARSEGSYGPTRAFTDINRNAP